MMKRDKVRATEREIVPGVGVDDLMKLLLIEERT